MTEKKAFIVTDLGGGDGGKGGVVHKTCIIKNAHTVVKVGGAQGSHGVRTKRGEVFNFSQFGCGTFEGIRTHITNLMVIEPYSLLREGELLKFEWGIQNIFNYITVDENALCITPFHTITSQLRELARKDNPKGTVGIGAGETVMDAELYPELAIYAKDLGSPNLRDKIETVKLQKIKDLAEIINNFSELWVDDQACAQELIDLLNDPDFTDRIVAKFKEMNSLVKITGIDYFNNNILNRDGVIVVESSHGILTDRYYGFHPHTTKLRTMPNGILNLLQTCNYDGEVIRLGVTRGYQIRHGAGPMVTETPDLLDSLLPGSNKDENRWQGKVRVGPLDLVALRYAINACGGPQVFDGLAVTWFDQIQAVKKWQVCDNYNGTNNQTFFSSQGEIKVSHDISSKKIKHQTQLGKLLFNCTPNLTSYDVSLKTQEDLKNLCSDLLQDKLNVPVRMISFGPTEDDKLCF